MMYTFPQNLDCKCKVMTFLEVMLSHAVRSQFAETSITLADAGKRQHRDIVLLPKGNRLR